MLPPDGIESTKSALKDIFSCYTGGEVEYTIIFCASACLSSVPEANIFQARDSQKSYLLDRRYLVPGHF